MKILQMHSDFIEYTPVKKEIKGAEEIEPKTVRENDIVYSSPPSRRGTTRSSSGRPWRS